MNGYEPPYAHFSFTRKLDANQKGAPGRYLAACLIHRYARQQNT